MEPPVFPAGYPEEMKKYGYPPPFPPGYPPERYEKYGYPPRSSQPDLHNSPPTNHQTQPRSGNNQASVSGDQLGFPLVIPPGAHIAIAGNVYNTGFNVNHSGTLKSGKLQVGNQNNK